MTRHSRQGGFHHRRRRSHSHPERALLFENDGLFVEPATGGAFEHSDNFFEIFAASPATGDWIRPEQGQPQRPPSGDEAFGFGYLHPHHAGKCQGAAAALFPESAT